MLYALYRMGYHSKATVHGFRAVFSTMANEKGFDGDVIEKALAHEQRNKVRAAYHRSEYLEQRRELMQWWGNLLQEMEYAQSSTEQMSKAVFFSCPGGTAQPRDVSWGMNAAAAPKMVQGMRSARLTWS
jgi:hypothetical protein